MFAVIFLFVAILCVPTFLVHEIRRLDVGSNFQQRAINDEYKTGLLNNISLKRYAPIKFNNGVEVTPIFTSTYLEPQYTVDISKWARSNYCRYFKANLWIIGIVLKVIYLNILKIYHSKLFKQNNKYYKKQKLILTKYIFVIKISFFFIVSICLIIVKFFGR